MTSKSVNELVFKVMFADVDPEERGPIEFFVGKWCYLLFRGKDSKRPWMKHHTTWKCKECKKLVYSPDIIVRFIKLSGFKDRQTCAYHPRCFPYYSEVRRE